VYFDGVPAPIFLASAEQINLQVPFEIAGLQSVLVIINYAGSASAPITVPVAAEQPAFFTITPLGTDSIATNQDNSLNATNNPAPRGSTVTLWGTGLGKLSYAVGTGSAAPNPPAGYTGNYTCTLGGLVTNASFAGWTPSSVGLAQFNVSIPVGTPSGAVSVTCRSPGGSNTQAGTLYVD
jgi:uncharacterized protein (TIGR03437 family)